jgi:hypothetical protein
MAVLPMSFAKGIDKGLPTLNIKLSWWEQNAATNRVSRQKSKGIYIVIIIN